MHKIGRRSPQSSSAPVARSSIPAPRGLKELRAGRRRFSAPAEKSACRKAFSGRRVGYAARKIREISRTPAESAGARPEQQRARHTLVHPRAARTEGAARRASPFFSARGKFSVPQGFQRQTRRICSAQNPAESAARLRNRQALAPEQQRARHTLVHPRAARTEGDARRASAFFSARGKVSVPQGFQRQTRRIYGAQNPAESAARPQNRQAPRRRSKARSSIHALRGLQKPRAKHRRSSHTRKYQHVQTAFIRQVFRNRRLICAARTIRKIGSASCPKATPLGDSECTDTAEPAAARPQNRKASRP